MMHPDIFIKLIQQGRSNQVKSAIPITDLTWNQDGVNYLHLACQNGYTLIVKYIIDELKHRGSLQKVVNQHEIQGQKTPIFYAIMESDQGNPDIVKQLLQANANPNARDRKNRCPLHYAAENGQDSNLQALVKKGGNVNAIDDDKRSPIHYAVVQRQFNAFKYLIQNGADCTLKDSKRQTLLHYAVNYGATGSHYLDMLIKEGVNPSSKDNKNNTALDIAVEKQNQKAVQYLKKQTPNHPYQRKWTDIFSPSATKVGVFFCALLLMQFGVSLVF